MKSKPNIRNRYLVLVDLVLIVAAILGAFALRFELGPLFFYYLPFAYWMIGSIPCIKTSYFLRIWNVPAYVGLCQHPRTSPGCIGGIYRIDPGYSSIVDILFTQIIQWIFRSVLIIDWLFSILLFGGVRFLLRLMAENFKSNNLSSPNLVNKRVLIIGAGDAGALVVRELQKNPDLNLTPVGFLDDNTVKWGSRSMVFRCLEL